MIGTGGVGRWRRVGMLLGVALLSGCTAGVSAELSEPIRPAGRLGVERVAVLPVTAEPGSEDAVPLVTDAVMEWLRGSAGYLEVVDPATARERIGGGGLAPDLARVFGDYDRSGVADPRTLERLSDAVDAPWFLQIRIGYAESEVVRDDLLGEDVSEEFRRDVRMIARLWRSGATAPDWEGTARADAETGIFADALPERGEMLRDITQRLLDRAPLDRAPLR